MPGADVELVLGVFDALARRAYGEAAAALREDAVWRNTSSFPGPPECVGREAIVAFWEGMIEDFDPSAGEQTVERMEQVGETVVVGLRSRGRGRVSDLPLDVRWAAVVRVMQGAIASVDVHGAWSRALASAGLPPDDR